ncbi:MAG: hypothetical protein RL238_1966 [Actinomycetota bacterium]|jgi:hypothetical protein
MSTKDTEINRHIDGETAEGHARTRQLDEAELRALKRTEKKAQLDDEAEGHVRVRQLDEADEAIRVRE